ncbi:MULTISPECIES: LysM domain-containing protein [unclassified Cryobacterium]|uniref:LysM peptidoglycan-binding domain-containing protein n=1 Tax=unclassified Cryobacterium TaxID=2649013 RepID=UPI00106C2069|nr:MULTISPECIES: LysM domain-containing protein [unclassified Cryobacterium]TFB97679.1 LysM domain-containing protein [Cryobacterium sp. MDB2-A-1]TFC07799.1 LysM domain-containing protein [Cryobacterium sp. MDB2-A-2]TFC21031.1 LysM domain-containing protein [Cryobacterium sp. MDB2-10]
MSIAAAPAPSATAEKDIVTKVPVLSDLTPGTLIATGEFSGAGTKGKIQIKANGADHGFDVTLTGLQPVPLAGTSLELNSLPSTASEWDLQHGFSYYRYDALSQESDQTFSTPSVDYGGFETNDPRFMRTAVIWAAPSGAPIGLGSVIATAALNWDLPNMTAGPTVTDHGSAEGARGQVSLGADGTPVSYLIAPNDTENAIAARFGITAEDLEWLNPDRFGDRLNLANITINLSEGSRGLRW